MQEFLILGMALIVTGLAIIAMSSFFTAETVSHVTIETTTTSSYSSDKFRAERGYWLEFDVSTTQSSTVSVEGQTVGKIFEVSGYVFKYGASVSDGDVYFVKVKNNGGRWDWFTWIPFDDHIVGHFSLKKPPAYYLPLVLSGAILVTIGAGVIPSVVYLERRARKRAESLYKCPSCRKDVAISSKVCPHCRIDLTKYWVRCKYCTRLYDGHIDKCSNCGAPTPS